MDNVVSGPGAQGPAPPSVKSLWIAELRAIGALSIPVVIQTSAQQGMTVTDQVFLGHLGTDELAAAALANSYTNLMWFFLLGFATALDTLGSHAYGAGDRRALTMWCIAVVLLLTALVAPLAVGMALGGAAGRTLFAQDERTSELMGRFCSGLIPGMWPLMWGIVLTKYLQVQNHMLLPSLIAVATFMLNIAFNAALVRTIGFRGAPLATSLSRWAQFLMLAFAVWRHEARRRRQELYGKGSGDGGSSDGEGFGDRLPARLSGSGGDGGGADDVALPVISLGHSRCGDETQLLLVDAREASQLSSEPSDAGGGPWPRPLLRPPRSGSRAGKGPAEEREGCEGTPFLGAAQAAVPGDGDVAIAAESQRLPMAVYNVMAVVGDAAAGTKAGLECPAVEGRRPGLSRGSADGCSGGGKRLGGSVDGGGGVSRCSGDSGAAGDRGGYGDSGPLGGAGLWADPVAADDVGRGPVAAAEPWWLGVYEQCRTAMHPRIVSRVLRLGIPGGLSMAFEAGCFDFSTVLAGRLGPTATAAHAAMLSVVTLTYLACPFALATAGSIRVGNLLGAGQPEGARRAGVLAVSLSGGFMALMALLLLACHRVLGYMFTSDPRVVEVIRDLAIFAALFQVSDGLMGSSQGVLRGCGHQHMTAVFNFTGFWVCGVLLGYLLCFKAGLGINGLWAGITSGDTTTGVLNLVAMSRIKWSREADKAAARLKTLAEQAEEEQAMLSAKRPSSSAVASGEGDDDDDDGGAGVPPVIGGGRSYAGGLRRVWSERRVGQVAAEARRRRRQQQGKWLRQDSAAGRLIRSFSSFFRRQEHQQEEQPSGAVDGEGTGVRHRRQVELLP